jgi:uncharacterized protein (TIGR02145 family)
MKKIFLFAILLATSNLFAQVGIGTTNPEADAILELKSSSKALLVTRVATTGAIANPLNGMIIYDISSECFKGYENGAWTDCLSAGSVPPEAQVPTNPATNVGTFSGKTCFDVGISNDNTSGCGLLSGRTAQKADFTQTATNTQTYTFTPSGTVSNVRFVYVNTNGTAITAITGDFAGSTSTAVTATVTFDNTLNASATGLTSSNPITSEIYVVFNNGTEDVQMKLNVNIKDCQCCGAFIAPGVFKEFMCHNLGADTSLDPHNMNQTLNYRLQGSHIMWGMRGPNTTGDSRVDWLNATSNSLEGFRKMTSPATYTADQLANTSWSEYRPGAYSWRTEDGSKGIADPCPKGYRVPTRAEWQGVNNNNTFSVTNGPDWTTAAKQSPPEMWRNAVRFGPVGAPTLTLPAAGSYSASGLNGVGYSANYWAADQAGFNSGYYNRLFWEDPTTVTYDDGANAKWSGFSVRCIAE